MPCHRIHLEPPVHSRFVHESQRMLPQPQKTRLIEGSRVCAVKRIVLPKRTQGISNSRFPSRFFAILCKIILLTQFGHSSSFLFARTSLKDDPTLYRVGLCGQVTQRHATPLNDEPPDQPGTNVLELPSSGQARPTRAQRTLGFFSLLTVPIIWGTYVPTIRLMYDVDPPVPGLAFSASYLSVAALSSVAALVIEGRRRDNRPSYGNGSLTLAAKAGLELGLYTFLANSLQVVGLETVPSDRAGFLIQLTTIMVPIFQAILDRNFKAVSQSTWIACVVALAGVAIMGLDIKSILEDTSMQAWLFDFTRGDFLIVGAAILYTMHVVRLGHWAHQTTSLQLASSKAIVQSILSLSLVAFLCSSAQGAGFVSDSTGLGAFLQRRGHEIVEFAVSFEAKLKTRDLPLLSIGRIIGAILWSGAVGTAYVLYAQSFGQRFVRPSDANLIYSLQPIFTAFFAYLLLGETMDAQGLVGGALILGSVCLAASSTIVSDQRDSVDSI